MRSYELMVIANPQLDEEALEGLVAKISALITDNKGELVNVDKWGKRRLAYEIKGNTEGFYLVIEFKAENETTTEVERVLKITDEVIRFLLVRKDEE